MATFQAIILGILQGLTEFLPVSSSGHLVLAQEIAGLRPDHAMAFDVALHGGTLVAVLVYFRNDLLGMAAAAVGRGGPEADIDRRWIGLLALATLPVVVVGLTAADLLETAFRSVPLVGVSLLFTAAMLAVVSRKPAGGRGRAGVSAVDALVIGSFQAVGVIPGISRSGATISGALWRGIDRDTAARFSFLLAVPAICGAIVRHIGELGALASESPAPLIAGTVASALTGWVAIEVMMRAVRGGRLRGFALYCLLVGGAALVWSAAHAVGGGVSG
ncbi:MAG: undecaprenyl-diphosphatase [Hyphomicrobiaceae bacterium]